MKKESLKYRMDENKSKTTYKDIKAKELTDITFNI